MSDKERFEIIINGEDILKYPKAWRTNQNLRWWLGHNSTENLTTGDDLYVHEYGVVAFAKQFSRQKLKEKDEEIKELREILLEAGAGHHHNKRLYEWYCKNK